MVQDTLPRDLAEGIAMAERQNKDGFENADGEFVDPRPVQLGAIREGFREAAQEDDFDVYTVVDASRVREGDSMTRNFNRVFRQWSQQTEKVAEEIAAQLRDQGYTIDEDG